MFRDALIDALSANDAGIAVLDGTAAHSYAELDDWSSSLAATLRPLADTPEDCAAVLLPNGGSWIAAYLAVHKAGMAVAPVNAVLTEHEIARVLEHVRPRAVLTGPEQADGVEELCTGRGLRVHVITVPPERPVARGPRGAAGDVRQRSEADAPCMVMHTSGSTGACRPLVQTGRALHLATGFWHRRHRAPDDVVAVPIPLAHAYGHLAAVSTLLAGATLLVSSRAFEPTRWLEELAARDVTVVEAVPTVYRGLLEASDGRWRPAALRRCLSAGQQTPAGLREDWHRRTGVELLQSWGMTELGGPGLSPTTDSCRDSAGVPVPGLEVRVVDHRASGRPAPAGTAGELWVRGAQVTPGRRTGSRQVIPVTDDDGWLRTGDLVLRDEHGCVRVVGRSKDTIMTGGYSVEPAEVEDVLRTHPRVEDAAVIARADHRRGEVPHAVVVPGPGGRPDAEELLVHCRRLLARYKVPRSVDFAERLPLSATGKLDRAALRERYGVPEQEDMSHAAV
ncbi:class I adenylate-forming enzyme family protein [Streptomyces abikoensis]|uniref:class I adenylate-forming enzyme family protein n=1 Tax=Streptomyces abikoensis TaxID=97398 RepID=UPI001678877A|nr:class I adenylate-forming enzyme family protein [Streptomyces abikoensis]GGP38152.1 long-chain-fatty-acid--CoA ligase [Streptomyces abikoensis]